MITQRIEKICRITHLLQEGEAQRLAFQHRGCKIRGKGNGHQLNLRFFRIMSSENVNIQGSIIDDFNKSTEKVMILSSSSLSINKTIRVPNRR